VDAPRCIRGADLEILRQLATCGLVPDALPIYQSQRSAIYQAALDQIIAQKAAYPCACSRKDIEAALAAHGAAKPRHGELIYPGTCRNGLHGKEARAWRFFTGFLRQNRPVTVVKSAQSDHFFIANDLHTVNWQDRRLGAQQQNITSEVGDFVLKRADGLWAYQLAVVADDAAQGITHIVRGEDLADNTARQILLQQALSYPTPQYLHTPLVLANDGHKLSKQNGALPLALENSTQAIKALQTAAAHLRLPTSHLAQASTVNELLAQCISHWKALLSYNPYLHAN
jgi:glutamyl-Q tRNA(Asp) synthetase